MTSSRDAILRSIRKHLPQLAELPESFQKGIRYNDPVAQFAAVLEGVGGECHSVSSLDEIRPLLGDLAGQRVVSRVPGLLPEADDPDQTEDPHALADVDLAVLPGRLAVAENAAVWVTDEDVAQRVTFFLCQHLALVVPRGEVVHTMHDAYDRLQVNRSAFGCFISGPSKTADIEQSLVKGAHGARTLKVFLLGSV